MEQKLNAILSDDFMVTTDSIQELMLWDEYDPQRDLLQQYSDEDDYEPTEEECKAVVDGICDLALHGDGDVLPFHTFLYQSHEFDVIWTHIRSVIYDYVRLAGEHVITSGK